METKLTRRKALSQKRFKPSFLQSPTQLQEPKSRLKATIKRPVDLEACGVVPWMEIFTESRRAVVLHQALLKSQHRHTPHLVRSKDPVLLLARGKTPELTKRYCSLLATRQLRTAGDNRPPQRAVSRPSVSAYSSPMHRDLYSRGQTSKLVVEGLSPRYSSPAYLHIETEGTTPVSTQLRQSTAVPQRQQSCKITSFNTEVIPFQPISHLTVLDIRRYINYLDQPPFR